MAFTITAEINTANLEMLQLINSYFNNIGRIIEVKQSNIYRLEFKGFKNCSLIKKHFDNYPLMTYKLVYFKVWSKILNIVISKNHLNFPYLLNIVALKSQFKKGLSPLLKESFPELSTITNTN